MNSRIIRISLLFAVTATAVSLSAFIPSQDKPWVVPEKFIKMANPVNSDAASLKEGKELWARNCQSCHGKTGMGDGLKAFQLKSALVDFSTDLVQKQTNGALFFKISEGRSDMPSFKKKLESEQDIWNLINYLRTLRK
jgi:mono/diheme cytochrome c family protein